MLPAVIQSISGCTVNSFKHCHNEYLATVPDKPQIGENTATKSLNPIVCSICFILQHPKKLTWKGQFIKTAARGGDPEIASRKYLQVTTITTSNKTVHHEISIHNLYLNIWYYFRKVRTGSSIFFFKSYKRHLNVINTKIQLLKTSFSLFPICGWMTLSLISCSPSIPYFVLLPYILPVSLIVHTAHIPLVTPIT